MEINDDYYHKDCRNWMFAVAFCALMPVLIIAFIVFSGPRRDIHWDIIAAIAGYSLFICGFAVASAIQCGKGKASGRYLAFLPCALISLAFPIGTVFGLLALIRVNRKAFVDSLR